MNTRRSAFRFAALSALAAGILIAPTLQAHELLPALYAQPLDRCIAELRAELDTTGAAAIRHTVIEIDRRGAWYAFDIRTDLMDDAGVLIGAANTRCDAHRWQARTAVNVTRQPTTDVVRLAAAE